MEENEMMVAWAANEQPSYTTINKSVSNDGLMMVFSIIIVAGILLPICAIIFGSTVLSVNLLGLKYNKLRYYTYKYYYDDGNYPRPIWDLIYCTAYCGYTLLFLYIVYVAITYSIIPVGKYMRFFTVMGIIVYCSASLLLISQTKTFFDVIGVLMEMVLIFFLTMDATDQF